ncbi:hypothetical protein NX801_04320 [Streptomyces sp. LP05-1]|uniref:Secreted protein n=1 Tax=Streptomyces pyxinae TaxID=2970734 RepID=A0ABT2CBV2_9ACTN|nr:hypothetical protein [Streptomyces sp. LP05-1]MCS0634897.1 hypothetical protein [Streptomyces sp. LP05-1]
MRQFSRTWAAGITSAAVLAGSIGAGLAVASPAPTLPKPVSTQAAPASVSAKSVRAWQQFRIRGAAKQLRPGSKVTLQQKQGKRWVSLPASMNTTRKSTYNLRVVLGLKGQNKLRLVSGERVVSPVFDVWVR